MIRLLGNNGASGYRQSIGWIDNNSRSHATVQIGYVGESSSGPGYGHFYIATSNSTSDEAPTERFRIRANGTGYMPATFQAANTMMGEVTISSTGYAMIGSNSAGRGLAICRDGSASYPDIVISSAGKVSIGTSTPYGSTPVPLTVRGEGDADSFGYPQLVLEGSSYDYPGMMFRGSSGTHGAIRSENGDGLSFWTTPHASISWAKALHLHENGDIDVRTHTYSNNIGGDTFRDLLIRNDGRLGVNTSSQRYKKNIVDISSTDWVHNLRVVDFKWKESDKEDFGLIAEEVHEIEPKLVSYNDDGTPEAVNYSKLNVLLLKEIQNLKKRIEDLEQ